MATTLAELRQVLAERFPDAVPLRYGTAVSVSTGISALDRVLPGGGLPRGRPTAWSPGGGAGAVLRGACVRVASGGERAAWVAGPGRGVVGSGWGEGVFHLRPSGIEEALECTEELLRTGGFGLVVLDGVEVRRSEALRLGRAVREGGGAFAVLADGVSAPLRLSSRLVPEGYRWRSGPFGGPAEVESALLRVDVKGLGVDSWVEFELPVIGHEVRLSLERGLVDRRGAGR